KPLLRPFVLLQRLMKLCEEGKYDDAVTCLQNVPLDAQNVVVWNKLIAEVMRARKFQLAHRLFTDMKRRGHVPTSYTYSVMMRGYHEIDDWEQYSKQLNNVHDIFDAFLNHARKVKDTSPRSLELSTIPFNIYLSILGKAQLHQKMLDVFTDMHDNGPLIPDGRTYTNLLHQLYERRHIPGLEGQAPVASKNASDAKYLWKQCLKQAEKGTLDIDAFVLSNLIKILSNGRPTDQLVAFDIVRDYVGLSKPGEAPLKPRVSLTPVLLSAILDLSLYASKPKTCIHFVQQLMDRPVPSGASPVLECQHMRQVITAYTSLSILGSLGESKQSLEIIEWMLRQGLDDPEYESRIRPDLSLYRAAFACFWRGKDWASATRAFELMTGYSAEDFRDGRSGSPKPPLRSSGKLINPDGSVLASMARTALATRDRANMRQCLRILDHFNTIGILSNGLVNSTLKKASPSQSIDDIPDNIGSSRFSPESEEQKRWHSLRSKAAAVLKSATYIPRDDGNHLGSEAGLNAMSKHIDDTMDSRYSRS
ncbi:hypothetical protein BC835DRAFT_1210950, partial [Cytidiella melzeri]